MPPRPSNVWRGSGRRGDDVVHAPLEYDRSLDEDAHHHTPTIPGTRTGFQFFLAAC